MILVARSTENRGPRDNALGAALFLTDAPEECR